MILKDDSVKIHGIRPELVYALHVADMLYMEYGQELVITSLNDGEHAPTSLHYAGCAADLRSRYFSEKSARQLADELNKKLGIDFDVIFEANHIHVEYQPRRR